jgi:hypothetical protein
MDIDSLTRGFIAGMCWAESGDPESPLGETAGELAPSTRSAARELCESFAHYCEQTGIDLDSVRGLDASGIGVDLWLTQAGHGAGFWDRGLGELGERLTRAAKTISAECYTGDDGLVYLCGYENHMTRSALLAIAIGAALAAALVHWASCPNLC